MKSNIIAKAIDDEDVNNRNMLYQQTRATAGAVVQKINFGSSYESYALAAKTLLEDPTVYDYDGVYDDMKRKKEEIYLERKNYLRVYQPVLLQQRLQEKEKRERQYSLAVENVNKKQRYREGQTGNTEYFVTKNFLELKKANERYAIEEAYEEEFNKSHTANMSGFLKGMFYQNLYRGGERVDVNAEMQRIQYKRAAAEQQKRYKERSRSRSHERKRKTYVYILAYEIKGKVDSIDDHNGDTGTGNAILIDPEGDRESKRTAGEIKGLSAQEYNKLQEIRANKYLDEYEDRKAKLEEAKRRFYQRKMYYYYEEQSSYKY